MNRSHWLDELYRDYVAKLYPQHSITVTNKWGVTVCGHVPLNPIGRKHVIEVSERNWVIV